MNTEMIAMTLIAHSGDARSLAFQALQAAKQNNFEEADRLMKESQEASTKAHQGQTDLLVAEANGEKPAFQALQAAKQNNFEEADRLMKESQEASTKAHQGQTDLLVAEANGEKPEINVLLIHSQDHLMTSMLAQEMVAEMIELYKRLEK